jgi:transcriptional regulator with XRE-family HTH domain
MKHIGRELAEVRRGIGLTQSEAAERLGADQSRVSRIEHEKNPRLDTLLSYARALDQEVMLVPRRQVSAVRALLDSETRRDRRHEEEPRFPTLDDVLEEGNIFSKTLTRRVR